MWWKDATETQKTRLRKLVEIGRFEIVNSSISMNDLLTTSISDSATNLDLGRQWCSENLGMTTFSKTAWMVDPFGIPNSQY